MVERRAICNNLLNNKRSGNNVTCRLPWLDAQSSKFKVQSSTLAPLRISLICQIPSSAHKQTLVVGHTHRAGRTMSTLLRQHSGIIRIFGSKTDLS